MTKTSDLLSTTHLDPSPPSLSLTVSPYAHIPIPPLTWPLLQLPALTWFYVLLPSFFFNYFPALFNPLSHENSILSQPTSLSLSPSPDSIPFLLDCRPRYPFKEEWRTNSILPLFFLFYFLPTLCLPFDPSPLPTPSHHHGHVPSSPLSYSVLSLTRLIFSTPSK